jgi:hypothetical protein
VSDARARARAQGGVDAQEAESDGVKEAACTEPDSRQVVAEEGPGGRVCPSPCPSSLLVVGGGLGTLPPFPMDVIRVRAQYDMRA